MRFVNRAIWLASLALLFAACQKELSIDTSNGGAGVIGGGSGGNNGANTEVGNWKFLGLHALTISTVEVSDGTNVTKSVTYSDYNSSQETGTFSFSGTVATTDNLSYTTDFTAISYIYFNNALVDSTEIPFSVTVPASSSSTTYQKIGSDSLYFQSGSFIDLSSGTSNPSQPAGYKLSWSGDTMFMKTVLDQQYTTNNQGSTQTTTDHADVVTKLLRL